MNILGIIDIPLWLLLILILIVVTYIYGTRNHGVWARLGVPGPSPEPLFGNMRKIRQPSILKAHDEWTKQYGRVYGFYFGTIPSLLVTDPDFLRQVFVKEFNNFVDRFFTANHFRPAAFNKGLFFLGGSMWKSTRMLMTPTFSASKLKYMCHYIERCCKILEQNLTKKTNAGEKIDVKDVFSCFTMDVITGTAFGLETNSQTKLDEPFVQTCKKFMQKITRPPSNFLLLSSTLPILLQIFYPVFKILLRKAFAHEEAEYLTNALSALVDERKHETDGKTNKHPDMLQLLVNAEVTPEELSTILTEEKDKSKAHKRLTKEEIIGQGFIVLIAGFETTASTLRFMTYQLALHQDVQQHLYEEIVQNIGNETPTYESVGKLKYLNCVIHETLRLFPPVPVINRRALKTTTIMGVTIPEGAGVLIPIAHIMKDPEFFPEPEKFNPDRFSEENRSSIHPMLQELAFGYGPRQCIGMRLALLEIMFAAVHIFRKFRFLPCEDEPNLTLKTSMGLTEPNEVVKLKTELRE